MNKRINMALALALSLTAHGTMRPAAEFAQAAGYLIAYNEPAKRLFKKGATGLLSAVTLYEISRKAYDGLTPTLNRWAEADAEKEQSKYVQNQEEVLTGIDAELSRHFPPAITNLVLDYEPYLQTALRPQWRATLSQAIEGDDPYYFRQYLNNRHTQIIYRGPRTINVFKSRYKGTNLVITKHITMGFLQKKLQELSGIDPADQAIRIRSRLRGGGGTIDAIFQIESIYNLARDCHMIEVMTEKEQKFLDEIKE